MMAGYIIPSVAVIPAEPGWKLLEPVVDDHDPNLIMGLLESPILAWRVDTYVEGGEDPKSFAYPVTIETLPDDYAIQQPNGQIVFTEDCRKNTREEAITHFQKYEDSKRRAATSRSTPRREVTQ